MSSLCLTLAEHSGTSLQKKIDKYSTQLDLIEVRLDYLDDVEIPALPPSRTAQFIATCRPPREGGEFRGTEAERLTVLELAVEAGFDWIDLEHDVPLAEFPVSSTRIVRSRHFFDSFPFGLNEILDELTEVGGDAYKIAVRVSTTSELVRLLSWVETLPAELPRVVLGMGELGQVSRIMGPFLRNLWTYVIEAEGNVVAPGQFSLQEAQQVFRVGRWDALTDLFLLVGTRVPSPERVRLLNMLFEHYGYAGVVLPCVVDDLATLDEYVAQSSLPFRGIGHCDLLDSGFGVDSVEDLKSEALMEGVAEQFCQWTDIDPDRDVIRGYFGGK